MGYQLITFNTPPTFGDDLSKSHSLIDKGFFKATAPQAKILGGFTAFLTNFLYFPEVSQKFSPAALKKKTSLYYRDRKKKTKYSKFL